MADGPEDKDLGEDKALIVAQLQDWLDQMQELKKWMKTQTGLEMCVFLERVAGSSQRALVDREGA